MEDDTKDVLSLVNSTIETGFAEYMEPIEMLREHSRLLIIMILFLKDIS